MLNLTPLLRPYFAARCRASRRWYTRAGAEQAQRRVLDFLLRKAASTAIGLRYNFPAIRSAEAFAEAVPVMSYPELRSDIMQMVQGRSDVLWPGRCKRFAQSSGTSDGKSKYIPITGESLRLNHYRGASDVVAHYLNIYGQSRLFGGKTFILGGSFANEVSDLPADVRVGDLSANLIDAINPAVELMRVPRKNVALMADWHQKLPALVEAAINQDITNISGVTSWFLTVLREVLKRTGADHIHQVWPHLEVFFHGGIAFGPYRQQYDSIIEPERMRYLETYNASEGFFAVQDTPAGRSMLLLLDVGVYYEFVPLDQIDMPHPRALTAWQVEPGGVYALIISACNGLWRYAIGDTVRVDSVEPLRITIAGRTHSYINAFGEELMVHNADAAIAATCSKMHCAVANYTAAPVFATSASKGCHQWLIEWATKPVSVEEFAAELDRQLCAVNSDYQAKRSGSIFLDCLQIVSARHGLFDDWLASTGKLGGQRKIPRLSPSRTLIESMLSFNK